MSNLEKAALVIPIFNEGERVISVIEAARSSPIIEEIIVVNDGSTDHTAEVLDSIGDLTVASHAINRGKGEALNTGMKYVNAGGFEVAVFLDGDLHGLSPDHIDRLVSPLRADDMHMSIGYLGLRNVFIKKGILQFWGALSGQRAIRTEIWKLLCDRDKQGWGVEAALNARLRKNKTHHKIARVALEGVGHVWKQEKEENWPRAIWGWTRTYGAALSTYARIELEGLQK